MKLADKVLLTIEEGAGVSINQLASWLGGKKSPEDVQDLIGDNVEPSDLKKGSVYIMKERSLAHQFNYHDAYSPVQFLGSTKETYDDAMKKTEYNWFGAEKNVKLKELEENDYYFFKGVGVKLDGAFDKTYLFGAYNWQGSLAIGSGAIKISLFEVNVDAAKKLGST